MQALHHLDQYAVVDVRDQLRLRPCSGLQLHRKAADTGGSLETSTNGVAGAVRPCPARAVRRVHESLEHTTVDQGIAAGGKALAVDVGRGVRLRVGRIVDEREQRRGDGFTDAVCEQAAALRDVLTVQRAAEHAEKLRRHERIEHDGDPLRRRLDGAEQPGRPIRCLLRGFGEIELLWRPPDGEAEAGLRLVAVVGKSTDGYVAAVFAAAHADPARRCDGCLTGAVAVVGVVDTHPRVHGACQPFEFLGKFDLAVGRVLGERVAPQLLGNDRNAIGFGEAGPFVGCSERDVVACLGQHRRNGVVVESAGVGETGATITDDTDADALALGTDEVLDLALVDTHVGLAATGDVRLDLLAGRRPGNDAVSDGLQFWRCRTHPAVPPMVIVFTRSVGWPSPTGTP